MSEIDSSHSETETSVVVADSSALIEESSHHSLNLKETGLLFFIMMIGNFFNYLFAVSNGSYARVLKVMLF